MANTPNNRRAKFLKQVRQRVVERLTQLSEGLTPTERIKAHTEYYETCSIIEKEVLLSIFEKEKDKDLTELCEFFEETYHV